MSNEYITFVCATVVALLALAWFIHAAVSYEKSRNPKPPEYQGNGWTVTASPGNPAKLSITIHGSGQTTWINMSPKEIDELIAALGRMKP